MRRVDVVLDADNAHGHALGLKLLVGEEDECPDLQAAAHVLPVALCPNAVECAGECELCHLVGVEMLHGFAQQVPLRARTRGCVVDVGLREHAMKDGILVAHAGNEHAPGHCHAVDLLRHDFKAPRFLARCRVGVLHLKLAPRKHAALEDHGHLLARDQALFEIERRGDRRVGEVVEVVFLVRRDHLAHGADTTRVNVGQIDAVFGHRRKGTICALHGEALFVRAIAAGAGGIVARFAFEVRTIVGYGGIDGQMQRARAVLRAVDVAFAPLHVENLGRHAVFAVRARHPRDKAVALAV